MIKFGLMANPTVDILDEIKRIAALGFDFVEITFEPPMHTPELIMSKSSEILKLLDQYHIFLVGHFTWWAEFGSSFKSVRQAWIYEHKKSMEVAARLGIAKINIHLNNCEMGIDDARLRKAFLDRYVESCRELVAEAKKFDIKLMIENSDMSKLTEKDMVYVLKNVKDLKFHLDVGHAMLGKRGMEGVWSWLKSCSKKIEHMHVHDNLGITDDHIIPGTRTLEVEKLVQWLKKSKYNKTITFEVFIRDAELLKFLLEKFKRLLA